MLQIGTIVGIVGEHEVNGVHQGFEASLDDVGGNAYGAPDMVVIGGIYGIGKRGDFVGSYLLALRDENNEFKSVALVGTVLDDATLEYLNGRMKELEISTKGREIKVEPKIVLEIAFSEIVESPEYETGYSLRFPVVKNIRKDKSPMDADTVERLLSMYRTGN